MILAYVDPSVMSYALQAATGIVIALGVVFGVVWRKIKRGTNKVLKRDENAGKNFEDAVKTDLGADVGADVEVDASDMK